MDLNRVTALKLRPILDTIKTAPDTQTAKNATQIMDRWNESAAKHISHESTVLKEKTEPTSVVPITTENERKRTR
jgi:hypothetical protein